MVIDEGAPAGRTREATTASLTGPGIDRVSAG